MTQPATVSTSVDEEAFVALKDEIAAYVANEGEAWTRRIEEERAVPPGLREELQARGYLSIAAPREYGGRGIPFSRWLELLELFSMSHASLRMIVHVANGVWRAVDQFATPEQRERFVLPAVNGEGVVAFTLTEPTAGTGADLRCSVRREGDTYLLSGEKHLITFGLTCDRWLLFARLEGTTGSDGTVALMVDRDSPSVRGGGHGRVARRPGHRPRPPRLRRHPGPGGEPPRRGGPRPGGRLRRLPDAEPHRRRHDLRRARAPRPGARGGARAHARHLRQAAHRPPGDRVLARRERRGHRGGPGARPARRPRVGGRLDPSRRDPVVDGQAHRRGHAHPRDRQGAAGARRHRLLELEPDRARLPRRARAALRGGHERDPEDDHRPLDPRRARVHERLRDRQGRAHHGQLARHRPCACGQARRRGRLGGHQLQAQRRSRRGGGPRRGGGGRARDRRPGRHGGPGGHRSPLRRGRRRVRAHRLLRGQRRRGGVQVASRSSRSTTWTARTR